MKVLVMIRDESEEGFKLVEMEKEYADRIKKMMKQAGNTTGEYPEAVNGILDKYSKPVKIYGTVDTSGDMWGYYAP
jgi:hypothetical protein